MLSGNWPLTKTSPFTQNGWPPKTTWTSRGCEEIGPLSDPGSERVRDAARRQLDGAELGAPVATSRELLDVNRQRLMTGAVTFSPRLWLALADRNQCTG